MLDSCLIKKVSKQNIIPGKGPNPARHLLMCFSEKS